IIVSILEKEPAPLSDYCPVAPAELEWIISKALSKDREQRYQMMSSLLVDLKSLQQKLQNKGEAVVGANDGQTIAETLKKPMVQVSEPVARTTSSTNNLMDRIGRYKLVFAISAIIFLSFFGIGVYLLNSNSKAIDSVAVMPLVNVGADPETEYLSDGITESLINNLSQLQNLKVMSRSSVFKYKGREKIGRE